MLSGKSDIELSLPDGATFREVVGKLAHLYPSLIGQIIHEDGKNLIDTNLFSLNGATILHSSQMEQTPRNGDKLILLSLLAGG